MTKRKSSRILAPSANDTAEPPARTSAFRFADSGRGKVPLGAHQSIHGAD